MTNYLHSHWEEKRWHAQQLIDSWEATGAPPLEVDWIVQAFAESPEGLRGLLAGLASAGGLLQELADETGQSAKHANIVALQLAYVQLHPLTLMMVEASRCMYD